MGHWRALARAVVKSRAGVTRGAHHALIRGGCQKDRAILNGRDHTKNGRTPHSIYWRDQGRNRK
jgi:hypothetical protein